jgi:Mu-like prophage major head subunit gpT
MPGGVITTGLHPKAQWPGVKLWWGNTYQRHPVEWTMLVDQDTDDRGAVEIVQDTGFSLAAVKPQGQSLMYDSNAQGFVTRIVHVTYALGYIVTWEELRDNQYEAVSRIRASANAFSMNQTKEQVVAAIYNRAFNSGFTGADGKALCATDHPTQVSGTFANKPTSDADLSEASLEDAVVALMGFTNDKGLFISCMPRMLIVPRQEWFNATRILQSVYQNDTANNAINALRATNSIPEGVKVNHYLTSAHAWFLRTNIQKEQGGLCLYQREPIMFDTDNDYDTKNAKAASIERYSVGWGDPRTIYGVNGP